MIAENETLYTLTCRVCGKEIARKRIHALENLADKEGWLIGDGRCCETYCPICSRKDIGIHHGQACPEVYEYIESLK